MSQKLINRNADLKRLRDEGYDVEVRAGFLLVRDVPYLDSERRARRGTLVVKLVLAGDDTAPPDTHVAHFAGDYPCEPNGRPIEQIRNASNKTMLAAGVTIDHTFSAKPKPAGRYADYYDQVSTYCSILAGPARTVDPAATPKTFPPAVPDPADDCPFHYTDTASSRAEIQTITAKLALGRVAIVGLGGTGAYVLDQVAKTPVREIHLFDRDGFLTHNAFRAPGAPSLEELRARPSKVAYFADIYSKMHRGIVPHAVHVDAGNVDQLRPMDFVFVCIDNGPAKKTVVRALEQFRLPFIDVGMGVYVGENALGGLLRVTTSTPGRPRDLSSRISFAAAGGENEYQQNIQIADLNALNAILAVVKWKKLFGFYMDFADEHHSTYGIETQSLTRGDEPA